MILFKHLQVYKRKTRLWKKKWVQFKDVESKSSKTMGKQFWVASGQLSSTWAEMRKSRTLNTHSSGLQTQSERWRGNRDNSQALTELVNIKASRVYLRWGCTRLRRLQRGGQLGWKDILSSHYLSMRARRRRALLAQKVTGRARAYTFSFLVFTMKEQGNLSVFLLAHPSFC